MGSAECLSDDVRTLAERLGRASVDVTLSEYADLPHVWHVFRAVLPQAHQALDEITGFLCKHA